MKRHLLFLSLAMVFLFSSAGANGQAYHNNFFTNSGGDQVDDTYLQVFPDGTTCQMGIFSGQNLSIGSFTFPLDGQKNIYVAHILDNGYVAWAKQFISRQWLFEPLGFRVDRLGNTHLAGTFSDTLVQVDDLILEDPTHNGNNKFFYAIIGPGGNVVSLTSPIPFENTASIEFNHVGWDNAGNMIVTGSFDGDSLWTGNVTIQGMPGVNNFFILCFNTSGVALWGSGSTADTSQGEPWMQFMVNNMALYDDGRVVLSGNYDGSSPIFGTDTLPPSAYGPKLFVQAYDAGGKYLWTMVGEQKGSQEYVYPEISDLVPLNDGGFYISGKFPSGQFTLGGITLTSPKESSYFIYRFNADTTVQWANTLGVEHPDMGKKSTTWLSPYNYVSYLIKDKNDNFYLTGYFEGSTLDFPGDQYDLIKTEGHTADQFVARYLADGTFLWARNITSDNSEPPPATLRADGSIFVADDAYDTIVVDEQSLDVPSGFSMGYIMGIDPAGNVSYLNKITGESDSYIDVTTLLSGPRNNLTILGKFSIALELDGIRLTAQYSSNLFLAGLSPQTLMFGQFVTESGTPVWDGMVSLIRLTEQGKADVADVVPLDDGGGFRFNGFLYGDYLIYALPDPTMFPNGVGTYFGNTALWFEADTVKAFSDTLDMKEITLITLDTALDGQGIIEGGVTYATAEEIGNLKSTTIITGEPVEKVKVILIGVEKSSDNIIAWVYTDDQGHFRFENIPNGDYRIMIDIPGLPMTSTYNISVKDNEISGLDFVVTDEDIRIATASGITHPAAPVAQLKVWPSPTTGTITLQTDEMINGTITVFNIRGQAIMTFTIERPEMTLDLSALPDGLYYLRALKGQKAGLAKVIIRHE